MLTRRQSLQRGVVGGAVLAFPRPLFRAAIATAEAPTMQLESFTQPLQVPPVAAAGTTYTLEQVARAKVLHPALANTPTRVWRSTGPTPTRMRCLAGRSRGSSPHLTRGRRRGFTPCRPRTEARGTPA